MTHESPTSRSPFPAALTTAFGTAVAMWIAGFLTHIPGAAPPRQATGAILIALQLGGAFLLGRSTRVPARAGAIAGLATGAINILILGALIVPQGGDDRPERSASLVIITYLVASTIAGVVGAFLGARFPSANGRARTTRGWLGRFGLVAVASVVPVLLSGALVTTVQAGLAVRDWPSTYGALMWLYPLARMTGGIYYEHAHRLFGSLVGLTTFAFLVFALISEPRRWTKLLILGTFLLVCAQGVLGGYRVKLATPTPDAPLAAPAPDQEVPLNYAQSSDTPRSKGLAMLHGVSAQVTLAVLCIAAGVTGRTWRHRPLEPRPPDRFLRGAALALMITLFIQLTLGAATRHFEHFHIAMTHLGFAVFVAIAAALAGFRTTRYGREFKPLKILGVHAFAFVALQIVLGFVTLMLVLPTYRGDAGVSSESTAALILATSHHAIGAALFATGATLLLWSHRLTSPARAGTARAAA